MNDTRASTAAMANLDCALKANRVDLATYHEYKDQVDTVLNSVYDKGQTCRRGKCILDDISFNLNIFKNLWFVCDNRSDRSAGKRAAR